MLFLATAFFFPYEMSTTTKSAILERLERLKEERREAQKANKQEALRDAKKGLAGKNESDEPTSHLDYTIEETEKWDLKQSQRKGRRDGTANMDDLAELTYYKDIQGLKIDKEGYEKQKGGTPDAKTELVNILAANNERKTKRKRKDADVDSFINEKNRQFNMKLNRQSK